MINVVCVKWGDKYSIDYVSRLYNMVKRNLSIPFKFWCFTDDEHDWGNTIEILETGKVYDGWWNKILLFHPMISEWMKGTVLYLDLDTVILRNIDDLAKIEHNELIYGLNDVLFNEIGTGVMVFEAGKHNYIWEHFKNNHQIIKETWGDQNFINLVAGLPIQGSKKDSIHTINLRQKYPQLMPQINHLRALPEGWCLSYRHQWLKGEFYDETKVIFFHGKDKPHLAKELLIKENWV